jgi:glycosyltransferase involved in cell wall biosynthesis
MRPHLLFLSHFTPYPPESGCTSRTLNVLKQLRSEFDVSLVMFSRRNHQRDSEARASARDALAQLGFRMVGFPVPVAGERSPLRRIADHLRGAMTNRPYTVYQYRSAEFGRQLQETMAWRRPDIVHIDALDLHAWLPNVPCVPVTCTHHDIESEHLRQRAANARNPLVAAHIRRQADLIEGLEQRLCPGRISLNCVCSELDGARLTKIAPESRTVVVPNGVDTDYFSPMEERETPGRVVFVGPTFWFPNRDAVEFLLDDIWPRVLERTPSATLHLIGNGPAEARARYARYPGVTVLGRVPDIRPHLAEASCIVAPLRYGGGTRVKILDAWAMAKPVVATTLGAEGLDAEEGREILLRDDPAEFADAITSVLCDPVLRKRLARAGRALVESRYAWNVVGARLRTALLELVVDVESELEQATSSPA